MGAQAVLESAETTGEDDYVINGESFSGANLSQLGTSMSSWVSDDGEALLLVAGSGHFLRRLPHRRVRGGSTRARHQLAGDGALRRAERDELYGRRHRGTGDRRKWADGESYDVAPSP